MVMQQVEQVGYVVGLVVQVVGGVDDVVYVIQLCCLSFGVILVVYWVQVCLYCFVFCCGQCCVQVIVDEIVGIDDEDFYGLVFYFGSCCGDGVELCCWCSWLGQVCLYWCLDLMGDGCDVEEVVVC